MPVNLIVDRRFCGPPASANGGYVAGLLAAHVGAAAVVTLRRPPPLDTRLDVVADAEGARLLHGDSLLAEARKAAPRTDIDAAPDAATAAAAAARTFPAGRHRIPGCFVCGPGREPGDGLRLHVGPVDPSGRGWGGLLAAPWTPAPDLGDAAGVVRPEFAWAALDCPSAYACGTDEGMPLILLGRQAVAIERLPQVGEPCIVVAQRQGRDGRKHFADSALFGADGRRLAVCNAIWIEVDASAIAGLR